MEGFVQTYPGGLNPWREKVLRRAREWLRLRNGNRMPRFEGLLGLLPRGRVFDGELVVLDDAGRRPLFNEPHLDAAARLTWPSTL